MLPYVCVLSVAPADFLIPRGIAGIDSEVDASRCFPERLEFHSSDREGCTGEKQRFEMDRSCKDNRQWEK